MPTELKALVNELHPITIPLVKIMLDPNNPRFIGPEWSYVSADHTADDGVQDSARGKLITSFGVERLAMNITVNGFLPMDRVVVQKLSGENEFYVVLEGNRRICAAKLVAESAETNSEISDEVKCSVENIDCLEYVGSNTDASWIFQGLRHISGISDWPAFNKAKLLVEQMEKEGLNFTDVGKRFALTPHGAGQWVRGYNAFQQASEVSDFINELDVKAYPYFQELFGRSSAGVREWMEWDEEKKEFKNTLNLNEFIGWLYPKDDDSEDESLGCWENKVLKSRDDIRQLSYLIREDREIFDKFRRELDVEKAYAEAMTRKFNKLSGDVEKETHEIIAECTKALEDIPLKILRDPDSKRKLLEEINALEEAIAFVKD